MVAAIPRRRQCPRTRRASRPWHATDIDSPSLTYSIVWRQRRRQISDQCLDRRTVVHRGAGFRRSKRRRSQQQLHRACPRLRRQPADDQAITVAVTDVNEAPLTVHWVASVDVGSHPAGWLPSGIGDFNADGTSDLAWYNSSTATSTSGSSSNGQWAGSADTGTHPAGYQPVGFGDYIHDGTSDVLWFNSTTRDVDLWKISNGQWAGSVNIGTHPAGWHPCAPATSTATTPAISPGTIRRPTRSTSGRSSNGQWAGSVDVGSHPAGYEPALTGDFNGDGTSDIAWYNRGNRRSRHLEDLERPVGRQHSVGSHPAGWQPLGAGDFNRTEPATSPGTIPRPTISISG